MQSNISLNVNTVNVKTVKQAKLLGFCHVLALTVSMVLNDDETMTISMIFLFLTIATEASGSTDGGAVQVQSEQPVQVTTRPTSPADISASDSATATALTATRLVTNTTWSNGTSSNSSANDVSLVGCVTISRRGFLQQITTFKGHSRSRQCHYSIVW